MSGHNEVEDTIQMDGGGESDAVSAQGDDNEVQGTTGAGSTGASASGKDEPVLSGGSDSSDTSVDNGEADAAWDSANNSTVSDMDPEDLEEGENNIVGRGDLPVGGSDSARALGARDDGEGRDEEGEDDARYCFMWFCGQIRSLLVLPSEVDVGHDEFMDFLDFEAAANDDAADVQKGRDSGAQMAHRKDKDAKADALKEAERVLFVWVVRAKSSTESDVVRVSPKLPERPPVETAYFVAPPSVFIRQSNIDKVVISGLLSTVPVFNLLRSMEHVFTPMMMTNTHWPISIRRELSSQIHKFMYTLTETAYLSRGSTVLYVPHEKIDNVEASARDKNLVQRLESAMIHWTRQIKEVVANHVHSQIDDSAGPLAEIEFWRDRAQDLSGVREQIAQRQVMQIRVILRAADSSYLGPFLTLVRKVQEGSKLARGNLSILSVMRGPCEELDGMKPSEIPSILPTIMHSVRMIWSVSDYYSSADRLNSLLAKVSNVIIARCCADITVDRVFFGDVDACIRDLGASIVAGEGWKQVFRNAVQVIVMKQALEAKRIEEEDGSQSEDGESGAGSRADRRGSVGTGGRNSAKIPMKPFAYDENAIFAHIDAFVQRCRDLSEICEAQIQFLRKSGSKRRPMPTFGGTYGHEIARSLMDVESSFQRCLDRLRNLDYDVLNVKVTQWHDDFNTFKQAVKDLELRVQNIITGHWEKDIGTVPAGVTFLQQCFSLAKRQPIVHCVEACCADLYRMFADELNAVKKEFDAQKSHPILASDHPKFAGSAMWAKGLRVRVQSQMELLQVSVLGVAIPADVRVLYNQVASAISEHIRRLCSAWVGSVGTNLRAKLEVPLMVQDEQTGFYAINFDPALVHLFSEARYWAQLRQDVPHSVLSIVNRTETLRVLRESVMLVVRDYNYIVNSLSDKVEKPLFEERLRQFDRRIAPALKKMRWSSKSAVGVLC